MATIDSEIKKQFYDFLVKSGYKEYTPMGNPSTAYDYLKRIEKVCKWEKLSWEILIKYISFIVPTYDKGGPKEDLGNKSHRAFINALKRCQEFKEKNIINRCFHLSEQRE